MTKYDKDKFFWLNVYYYSLFFYKIISITSKSYSKLILHENYLMDKYWKSYLLDKEVTFFIITMGKEEITLKIYI